MPQAPSWADDYVGIPYVDYGRDKARGLDCWGVLMHVLYDRKGWRIARHEELGYDGHLPRKERLERAAALAQFMDEHVLTEGWRPVWKREGLRGPMPDLSLIQAFDGVRLRMDGVPLHVGVAIGDGWFLHTEAAIDCMAEEFDDPKWINRIDGVYRWREAE